MEKRFQKVSTWNHGMFWLAKVCIYNYCALELDAVVKENAEGITSDINFFVMEV
jgi:hypothetical protein